MRKTSHGTPKMTSGKISFVTWQNLPAGIAGAPSPNPVMCLFEIVKANVVVDHRFWTIVKPKAYHE